MKKYVFILFLFLGLTSYAQENIKLGFRNGITFSTIESVYYKMPIAMEKGIVSKLYLEFLNHKFWNLHAGVGFVQKGFSTYYTPKKDTSIIWGDYDPKKLFLNKDFLTIDVSCKIKYSFGKFTPFVLIGPKLDLLVGEKSVFTNNPEFKTLDKLYFGLDYSAGISYDFNYFNVLLGYKKEKIFYFQDVYEKDLSSQIYVDILIPLKKQ